LTGPRLYGDLASWWPVMSDPADYAEEAAIYRAALESTATGPLETLLELGSGGGHNASHLKTRFQMTLVDRSTGMLAVSRDLNPACEHVEGDMRTVRLGRTFDAVLIHDAIMYCVTRSDLDGALATALAHCRPGGWALFVPDDDRETFRPETSCGGHDRDGRSLRYVQWTEDPDPSDTSITTHFAYLLRERSGGPVRVVQDEHVQGLFARSAWLEAIEAAGFESLTRPYRHSSFAPDAGRVLYLGRRPA
jgi:hypothetical protein